MSKLPDSYTTIFDQPMKLVNRLVIAYPQWKMIGKKRIALPPLQFVISTARPA